MIEFRHPDPTHICANPDCHDREWHVEPDDLVPDLWHLRGRHGVFTLASHDAVCPICSNPLLEIARLEIGTERATIRRHHTIGNTI